MSTTIAYIRQRAALAPRGPRILEFLGKFYAGIQDARSMYDRYEQLSRMSDSELARRGLTRSEITQAVASCRNLD